MRHACIICFTALATLVHAEDIKLLNGTLLKDAKITSYDAIGVTITHSAGIARVPFDELPAELRQKFTYDPEKAHAQADAEARAIAQRAQEQQSLQNNAAHEAAEAQLAQELDKVAVTITGKVLSVAPDGLLLSHVSVKVPALKDVVVWRNPLDGSPRYARVPGFDTIRPDEPIFIYGAHGLVDGDIYSAVVYPAPHYSYAAASGAAKTVRAFAASKQLCRELLQNEDAK